MRIYFLIFSLITAVAIGVGATAQMTQDPLLENDNECFAGGLMEGQCETEWHWVCGWYIRNWRVNGGLIPEWCNFDIAAHTGQGTGSSVSVTTIPPTPVTGTPLPTATITPIPSATPTGTVTPVPTSTPTATVTPFTPVPTSTPTATVTQVPTSTPTATVTPI